MATNYMQEYNLEERKRLGDEIVGCADDANYKKDALSSIHITNILVGVAIKLAGIGSYDFEVGETDDALDWSTLCEFRSNTKLQQLVARHLYTFQLRLEKRDKVDRCGEYYKAFFVSWGAKQPDQPVGTLVIDPNWRIDPYKPWLPDADKD